MSTGAAENVALHAHSATEGDRTLCGDVNEGDETIELQPPVFAEVGQCVTCPRCRQIIADCIALYTPNFRRRA